MTDWDKRLCLAQFAINNSWHETVQQTPFYLNHGRAAATPLDILLPHRKDIVNPASCKFAEKLQQLTAHATKLTLAAQQRQKRYYDAKHTAVYYAVNEEVLLITAGLNLKITGTNKLAPKWVGPLKVFERVGNIAYRLNLPGTMKIHDVFHVSLRSATTEMAAFRLLHLLTSLMTNLSGRRSPFRIMVKRGRKNKVE